MRKVASCVGRPILPSGAIGCGRGSGATWLRSGLLGAGPSTRGYRHTRPACHLRPRQPANVTLAERLLRYAARARHTGRATPRPAPRDLKSTSQLGVRFGRADRAARLPSIADSNGRRTASVWGSLPSFPVALLSDCFTLRLVGRPSDTLVATVGFLRPGIGAAVPSFSSSSDVSWRAWRRVRDKSEIAGGWRLSMRFGFRPTWQNAMLHADPWSASAVSSRPRRKQCPESNPCAMAQASWCLGL